MTVATKTRGKAKAKGPPPARSWKHSDTNLAYEERAKTLLRFAIKQSDATYADLARALSELGVEITPAALENKISRGGFSAAFLLQCAEALNINVVTLPR